MNKGKVKKVNNIAMSRELLDRKAEAQVRKRVDMIKGEVQRQAKTKKGITKIHENRRFLDERAFYPAHDKRRETPKYKKIHNELVKKKKLPCIVCGVNILTLKDPAKNPYGARQLETHHHVIEWALANAIDTNKFNERVLPHLRARHPEKYKNDFTATDVKEWVDHDPDNLWVLCDVHHRHKWLGIHMITQPIWGPQDLLTDSFTRMVNEELKNNADVPKKKQVSRKKG